MVVFANHYYKVVYYLHEISSLKLSYDNRNSSLESTSTRCNETGYSCTSQYDAENETDVKMEGPFSKCVIRNENRMVGSYPPSSLFFTHVIKY